MQYDEPDVRRRPGPDRKALISLLTRRVDALIADGMTERDALRAAAAEAGLHPMRVKRLVVLFPEA